MRTILGIDPGLRTTGWGIISDKLWCVDSGIITTNNTIKLEERLYHLYTELLLIIDQYQPCEASLEETFVNKNYRSSLMLAHARAVLILAVRIRNIPLEAYTANFVKQTVTSNGHANKEEVRKALSYLVTDIRACTTDAFDALAIAVCHHSCIQRRCK